MIFGGTRICQDPEAEEEAAEAAAEDSVAAEAVPAEEASAADPEDREAPEAEASVVIDRPRHAVASECGIAALAITVTTVAAVVWAVFSVCSSSPLFCFCSQF